MYDLREVLHSQRANIAYNLTLLDCVLSQQRNDSCHTKADKLK
jgi:hypothetical protein